MSDIDRLINETLDDEDRVLREALGKEPGVLGGFWPLLIGPRAWANWVMLVSQGVMFCVGVWLAWEFFRAEDVLEALRYGLPAVTLFVMAIVIKTSMTAYISENRLLIEIRRLELRIERMRQEKGDA
ncbi:hypothetical protein F1654_03220 [Alkalicaulis satelles]|uniref:Uncharacterized protein n=1 Tax=Alkalicaulis satelles TaxID=2609175 RepID=A0A5M6ZRV6_9PROT|nr:DUF6768 family protein [Alkalicaulis satelles]KAA5805021.1 hypothetical protein F1654_03220 [Alkalicaulis satelles]